MENKVAVVNERENLVLFISAVVAPELQSVLAFDPAQGVGILPGVIVTCLWPLNRIPDVGVPINDDPWRTCIGGIVGVDLGETQLRGCGVVDWKDAGLYPAVESRTGVVHDVRAEGFRVAKCIVVIDGHALLTEARNRRYTEGERIGS